MTSEKIVEICKGKCIEDFLAIWQSQGKSWGEIDKLRKLSEYNKFGNYIFDSHFYAESCIMNEKAGAGGTAPPMEIKAMNSDLETKVTTSLRNALTNLGLEPMPDYDDNSVDIDLDAYGVEHTHPKYGEGCFAVRCSWSRETSLYSGYAYFLDKEGDRPFEFNVTDDMTLEQVFLRLFWVLRDHGFRKTAKAVS